MRHPLALAFDMIPPVCLMTFTTKNTRSRLALVYRHFIIMDRDSDGINGQALCVVARIHAI